MSGQPTPPRLVEPFANSAPSCTQAAPIAGGKTAPFPVPSQQTVLNGAASLTDGFVPLNMTEPGGTPPFGQDMNGILFIVSAWAAFFAAGQYPAYDATLQTVMGGYALGARVQQAANPTAFWISIVAANMTDPDTSGAGWVSSVPLYSTAALSGTNNVVLPSPSDLVINVTAAAGPFTGFVAQRDNQSVTFLNNSGANLQFNALTGSSAGNQIMMSGNFAVANGDSLTIKYSQGAGVWYAIG